ncbi:MAG: hypothetical protein R3B09_34690, partial [Nannocystaceae bacterium]
MSALVFLLACRGSAVDSSTETTTSMTTGEETSGTTNVTTSTTTASTLQTTSTTDPTTEATTGTTNESTTTGGPVCDENLMCDEDAGEDIVGCLHDCAICTPTGKCTASKETPYSCPEDCPATGCDHDGMIDA